jgi:hypothetical protein
MVKDLIKKKKMIVKRTCCWHQFSLVDKFTIIKAEKKSPQQKITNTNYSNLGLVMVRNGHLSTIEYIDNKF